MPLAKSRLSKVDKLIRLFHAAMIPDQAIPEVGNKLHVLPIRSGYGLYEVDLTMQDSMSSRVVKDISRHDLLVLFQVEFIQAEIPYVSQCFTGIDVSLMAAGHQLLSPKPPRRHEAWERVKRVMRGKLPFIIPHKADNKTLTPTILTADIVMLTKKAKNVGWHDGANCYIIRDLNKL